MALEQSQAFESLGEVNDALQKCDETKVGVEGDGGGLLELITIVYGLQKDFFQALINRCLLVFRCNLTCGLDVILYCLAHLHDLLLLFLVVVLLFDLL